MTYVLVALICAAVGYSARIIMEYIAAEQDLLPTIDRLNEQSEKLSKETEWESDQRGDLRGRVEELRRTVDDLQARVNLAKKELQTEQTLLKRLELEANRKELKSRRKVSTG